MVRAFSPLTFKAIVDRYVLIRASLIAQSVKNQPASARDWGMIPHLGISIGEGNDKKAKVTIFLSDKIDFKTKAIKKR